MWPNSMPFVLEEVQALVKMSLSRLTRLLMGSTVLSVLDQTYV